MKIIVFVYPIYKISLLYSMQLSNIFDNIDAMDTIFIDSIVSQIDNNNEESKKKLRVVDESLSNFVLQLDQLSNVDRSERKTCILKIQEKQKIIDFVLYSSEQHKKDKNLIKEVSDSHNDISNELDLMITKITNLYNKLEDLTCKNHFFRNENDVMKSNISELNKKLKDLSQDNQSLTCQLRQKEQLYVHVNNKLKLANLEIEVFKKVEKPPI